MRLGSDFTMQNKLKLWENSHNQILFYFPLVSISYNLSFKLNFEYLDYWVFIKHESSSLSKLIKFKEFYFCYNVNFISCSDLKTRHISFMQQIFHYMCIYVVALFLEPKEYFSDWIYFSPCSLNSSFISPSYFLSEI